MQIDKPVMRRRIQTILTKDYMSSEESGDEEGVKVRYIKSFPNESQKLKKYKKTLDKRYRELMTPSQLASSQKVIREQGRLSMRTLPETTPGWTLA